MQLQRIWRVRSVRPTVCDRISLKLDVATYAKLGQTMRELLLSSTRSLTSAARAKTVRLLAKLPDDTSRNVEDPQRIVTDWNVKNVTNFKRRSLRFSFQFDYLKYFMYTIKLGRNNHPRNPILVNIVDRWSLFRGQLCYKPGVARLFCSRAKFEF